MEKLKPFVVAEGGSGVGKTTAIEGIKQFLPKWKFLREPGGTAFGDMMRDAVQQHPEFEIDPMAAFLAYSASRANLVNCEILPVLTGSRDAQGVFLDRYWFSSYAYQGAEKIDKGVIMEVSRLVTGGVMPDLVLHFDLLPELAMSRKIGCGDIDRYDQKALDFHTRVRDAYLELSLRYPKIWQVIDASASPMWVLGQVMFALKEQGMI